MKFLSLLVVLILGFDSAQAAKAPVSKGSKKEIVQKKRQARIRIRLTQAKSKINLKGLDLKSYALITNKKPRRWRAFRKDPGISELQIRCKNKKIEIKNLKSGQKSVRRGSVAFRSGTEILRLNGRIIREELRIYSRPRGCEAINVVQVDHYLEGVVNSEFSSKWHPESVAAQVVAARTYAVYRIREARMIKGSRFDIESSIFDQVYDGFGVQDIGSVSAIEKTRGLVLSSKKGKRHLPIKAFYHSTCGGMTELPQYVWGEKHPSFNKRVKCPHCHGAPRFNWKLQAQSRQILKTIYSKMAAPTMAGVPKWPKGWKARVQKSRLSNIVPGKKNTSGRVRSVGLVFQPIAGGKTFTLWAGANNFRMWMDPIRLKSTSFSIVKKKTLMGQTEFTFQGRGFGHGVGLCQYGAKTMAEKGRGWRKILSHYYPEAKLRKIW